MARILCITTGLTGILNASFELVNRLQADGHHCICASPASVGERVQAQGLEYVQLNPVNYEPAPAVPNFTGPFRRVQRALHKITRAKQRKAAAIAALGMDAFRQSIVALQSDLVIIDIELHEHIMTLHHMGQRFVLLSQWFSLWNRNGLPPIVSDFVPSKKQGESEKQIRQLWKQLIRKRKRTFDKKKLLSVGTDRRSILLAYARANNFPLAWIQENYWPGPLSYDVLPVLSMTAFEAEFPHDVRPALTYVGPMVSQQRKEPTEAADNVERVEQVIQNRGSKKLIYCSVSTFRAGDTRFLHNAIAAVAGQSNWLMIIGLGGMLDASEFDQLPANVYAFANVPQLKVLARANLSINHGGIHTINECLHFGVPMLVYSGKRSDQNGCAARVHYHQLGYMADKDADTPEMIRHKIEQLLGDANIAHNVKQLQKATKAYKTGRVLEQTIAALLTNPTIQEAAPQA